MIPVAIVKAADEHGWKVGAVQQRRKLLWISLGKGNVSIYIWRNKSRHTWGRAFRGNALTAVLNTQDKVVAFLALAT